MPENKKTRLIIHNNYKIITINTLSDGDSISMHYRINPPRMRPLWRGRAENIGFGSFMPALVRGKKTFAGVSVDRRQIQDGAVSATTADSRRGAVFCPGERAFPGGARYRLIQP